MQSLSKSVSVLRSVWEHERAGDKQCGPFETRSLLVLRMHFLSTFSKRLIDPPST